MLIVFVEFVRQGEIHVVERRVLTMRCRTAASVWKHGVQTRLWSRIPPSVK